MFNAPRPAQRYQPSSGNGNFGGSFVEDNPLGGSAYDDGHDPWSAAPSPSPPPMPTAPSLFGSVIADATLPSVYTKSFALVDPPNSGETSVNSLSRVLQTSSLPAATVDKIVNLVSNKPRVSKLEFYVALALVALAQSGKDISIEQVAALASQNTLPEPNLDLSSFQPSISVFTPPSPSAPFREPPPQLNVPPPRAPAPQYSADDPWNTARFSAAPVADGTRGAGSLANGAPSSVSGTGLPKDWWKKLERVNVSILGQQGFILNRYTVFEVASDRGPSVPRRYSEFVFLWDCLVRRYPFRLLHALPPKRIQPDEHFLEQRRLGLARFINSVVNHPVIKDDGLIAVFLTEPSFEAWKKHSSISLEEESASKRVDRVEEMSIPSDLEEKLTIVKQKIPSLIEQWQKICILAERIIKRREAAAVWIPSGLRRNSLTLPLFSSSSSPPNFIRPVAPDFSSASSIFSASTIGLHFGNDSSVGVGDDQADLSRLSNVLKVVAEVNERCWRGDDCELCDGVREGVGELAAHTQSHSDILEQRTRTLLYSTLEALKSQRDLYMATRDLFIRHARLSIDQVERLRKRIETTSSKLEGVKAVKKEGWETEVDRFVGLIEKDQATIAAQLHRRVFIRACLWHELRVVLHNRENALLTKVVKAFAGEEQVFADTVSSNWVSLVNSVESMPYE